MNRDELIQHIRPRLVLDITDAKPLEAFQNETLRPILKLQNEVTQALMRNHKNYKPELLSFDTRQQYETYLSKYIQTNIDFKNQLIGVIVGLFTTKEMLQYKSQAKELNRRIVQMQLKRYVDTAFPEPSIDS